MGKPESITNAAGIISYTYDDLGRVSSYTDKIENIDYTYHYSYNPYGNLTDIIYPDNFHVIQMFDANGYFINVASEDNNIWTAMQTTSTGRPERDLFGNYIPVNYSYDYYDNLSIILTGTVSNKKQLFMYNTDPNTGNLSWRKDMIRNLTETFTYDNLDRLTGSEVFGQTPLALSYQPNGNILSKDDAGNYAYHPVQIHAVTELTGNPSTVPENDQNIEYTSFNKVKKVTEDGLFKKEFIYGPDEERRVSTLTNITTGEVTKKVYVGSYEVVTDGVTEKKYHYINGSNGPVAMVVTENNTYNYYYFCKDHLGSVTGLLDQNGNMAEEYNYDAWGRRRNPADWTYDNVPVPTLTDRGFTFHEHMDKFGLINMNGRMYDPLVGRMLSPDPMIQAAGNTQGLNRYSYCFNNPLKYIDPSGYAASSGGSNPYASVNHQLQFENYNWYNYMTSNFSDNLYWSSGSGFVGYGSPTEKTWNDFFNRPYTMSENNAVLMSSWKEAVRNRIQRNVAKGGWGAFVSEAYFGWDNTFTENLSFNNQPEGVTNPPTMLKGVNAAWAYWYSFSQLFIAFKNGNVNWAGEELGWIHKSKALTLMYSKAFGNNQFQGLGVYHCSIVNSGSAFTIPDIGIFKGSDRSSYKPGLMAHEYGHQLQANAWGYSFFIHIIAPTSIYSSSSFGDNHRYTWTELSANKMSFNYFGFPTSWQHDEYPISPFGLPIRATKFSYP